MPGDTRVVPFTIPSGIVRLASNQNFLELIYGDQWRRVLVTSFKRDPADPNAPREDWNGWPAEEVLGNPHFDEGNTYFCPALLTPGTRLRQIEHFEALHVLVIDDIGTKVRLADMMDLLRTGPTYVLETSPGNHQAGWKIEPEKDLAWVKGMLTQLDQALGGKADNLTNPIAWRRLPVGWNTKSALVQVWGPQGWKVKITRAEPRNLIRGLDWVTDIEPQIGEIPRLTTMDRGIGNGVRPDAAVLGQDPVYRALEAGGYVLGEKLTSDKFWAVTIKCPWAAGHGPTRPLSGAEYVPAGPGTRGWFHCFHCETRGQAEFHDELNAVLRADGAKTVAAFDFDEIDPAAIVFASSSPAQDAVDLWSQKEPPAWPGGVFPAVLEDTLAELAERDSLDLGALGASLMTAASGAADKRTQLKPYAGSHWAVPPVLWLMLIAPPGQRKTAVLNYTLGRLRKLSGDRMGRYIRAMGVWEGLPRSQRRMIARPTVEAILAEDVTVEKLQEWMSWNPRGFLYMRDELAGLLEFSRYGSGTGAAARASFLEFYEGGPTTIGRMTRTTVIENCALSMIGGIQPQRLAAESDLANDGFLSRFGTVTMQGLGDEHAAATATDTQAIDATMDRLLDLAAGAYVTDPVGERMIRDMEAVGRTLSQRPDLGVGAAGFLAKLHGTHARTSLVLHLIDGGQQHQHNVVPADTVERAGRYAVFLFDHAESFYAGLPGSAEIIARAIGSWLLRKPTKRITVSDLKANVAGCRKLNSDKDIQAVLWPLIVGGWLKSETPWPDNRSWLVRPGLQGQFADRLGLENTRVEARKDAMNHQGRYR